MTAMQFFLPTGACHGTMGLTVVSTMVHSMGQTTVLDTIKPGFLACQKYCWLIPEISHPCGSQ